MKKIIVSLAIALLTFTGATYAAASTSANVAGGIPETVNTVFTRTFHTKEVKWETGKNFYKATFEFNGRTLFAFFAGNGDLMGVAANLSPVKLPETLRTEIKTTYPNYWITDLFRYHNADDDGFVVTLESPEKTVILRALGSDEWTVLATKSKE